MSSSSALIPGTSRVTKRGVVGRRRPRNCSMADEWLMFIAFPPHLFRLSVSGEGRDWT